MLRVILSCWMTVPGEVSSLWNALSEALVSLHAF